jgi:hypothetical protein
VSGSEVQKLLLSAEDAARALSISTRTLWARRIGSRVLYPVPELKRFAESEGVKDEREHLQGPERA